MRKQLDTGKIRGVEVLGEGGGSVILCGRCFGALLDEISWDAVDKRKICILHGCRDRRCDMCRAEIEGDRRSGSERRKFEYDCHLPERRENGRRCGDEINSDREVTR